MASLIIDEGGPEERRVELGAGVTFLGRDEESDVRFAEDRDFVAVQHASLQAESDGWFVRDEGSVYGTFVNDRRVREHRLHDGDTIELGLGGPRIRFRAGEGG